MREPVFASASTPNNASLFAETVDIPWRHPKTRNRVRFLKASRDDAAYDAPIASVTKPGVYA
jgi:hypothetical protein